MSLITRILKQNNLRKQIFSINNKVTAQFLSTNSTKDATTDDIVLHETAPTGVSEEIYSIYREVITKTSPSTTSSHGPKSSLLNQFFTKIETLEEYSLIPSLLQRWRSQQLKYSGLASRFPFHLAEKFQQGDIAFELLADRHRYNLQPRVREFQKLLAVYINQMPTEGGNQEDIKKWGEKVLLTYGLLPYYQLKPDQEIADLVLTSLLNSPLKEEWFPFIYKLAHELKQEGITMTDENSHIIAELVTKLGRPSYGTKIEKVKE
ncbi:hypothetical protein K502DRAFT_338827 [Neoconidiobolus thromboides FSU 785]|nr:hypothetical protein K502DRAFT_338827 [Neoconidiobolus thromboides FSU 785]